MKVRYLVYCTTNLINYKKYIGSHVEENLNDGYLGSGTDFLKAIKKYGKENFHQIILAEVDDFNTMREIEVYWCEYFNVEKNRLFYNRTNKGVGMCSGFKYSEESKIKMRKPKKEGTGEKISRAQKGIKKHPFNDESKKKISDAKKGHACFNDEWRNKISNTIKNHNHSQFYTDEVKKKISDSMKGRPSPKSIQCVENMKIAKRKNSKRVIQYDLQGNKIREWLSKGEAADWIKEKLKINSNVASQIKDCILGRQKTSFGFIWRYKDGSQNLIKFEIINQFNSSRNLINKFKSFKELKEWLRNNTTTSIDTISSNIKKQYKQKIYKSGGYFYSSKETI